MPEGALSKPRLNILTYLSEPFRTFDQVTAVLARVQASPRARTPRLMQRRRRSRPLRRVCGQLEDGVPHARALSPANRWIKSQENRPF